jgi:SnoaL-like domain
MKSDGFKAAAETKDFDAAADLFAEDVTFRSPFVHTLYEGLDAIKFILGNVVEVFENFRYIGQTETDDQAVLMFEANVGDRDLQGVDIFKFNAEGKISEMTVMVRPMSGLQALSEQMGKRLEAMGVAPG